MADPTNPCWKPSEGGGFRARFENADGGKHYATIEPIEFEGGAVDYALIASHVEMDMARRGYDRPVLDPGEDL